MRDYDPFAGRFTAKYPAKDMRGDGDLMDYCVDDPVSCVDPSGMRFREARTKDNNSKKITPGMPPDIDLEQSNDITAADLFKGAVNGAVTGASLGARIGTKLGPGGVLAGTAGGVVIGIPLGIGTKVFEKKYNKGK